MQSSILAVKSATELDTVMTADGGSRQPGSPGGTAPPLGACLPRSILQVPEERFWEAPLGQVFLSEVVSLPPQSHSFHHHLFRGRMGTTTVGRFRILKSIINETPVSAVDYHQVSHTEVPKSKLLYHLALQKYSCSSKKSHPWCFCPEQAVAEVPRLGTRWQSIPRKGISRLARPRWKGLWEVGVFFRRS